MSKKWGILLFVVSLVFVILGMFLMFTQKERVQVIINGVLLPGEHTVGKTGAVYIDNTDLSWLTKQTSEKQVATKDLQKYFKVVKENWNKESHVYQAIVLPKEFQYVSEENAEGQMFAEAKTYPKGVMIHVKGYRIDFSVLEMTPTEDFEMGIDRDGFEYGYNQKEWLEGLPLPSPLSVEVVDYPKGHAKMENIEHFSVRLNY